MKLNNWMKAFLIIACLTLSIVGFMIKLPAAFRHMDKELHALFYFLAAALLNVLFAGGKLIWHVIIFIALFLFGMAIEYGQDYSNRFFHRRIHGRFDPEDVQANLKGLIAFSLLWVLYTGIVLAYRKATSKNKLYQSKLS